MAKGYIIAVPKQKTTVGYYVWDSYEVAEQHMLSISKCFHKPDMYIMEVDVDWSKVKIDSRMFYSTEKYLYLDYNAIKPKPKKPRVPRKLTKIQLMWEK